MRNKGVRGGGRHCALFSNLGNRCLFDFILCRRLWFNIFPFPPSAAKILGNIHIKNNTYCAPMPLAPLVLAHPTQKNPRNIISAHIYVVWSALPIAWETEGFICVFIYWRRSNCIYFYFTLLYSCAAHVCTFSSSTTNLWESYGSHVY
jgi:hypothetical protein